MKKVLFLFGELTDLDVEWLMSHGVKEKVSEGQVLIRQGQPIDRFYVVLEGVLAVQVDGHSGNVAEVGPGEILGEMSFVDSRNPSTTIRAAGQSILFSVARSDLSERLRADSGFAARFYRALCLFLSHRLRRVTLGLRGSGESGGGVDVADELDGPVLDQVYLAGQRFQRMAKGAAAG